MGRKEELKKMVGDLNGESDKKKIVEKLQEIGDTIVGQCVFRIGEITVEPLWVEAYYVNKEKFIDETCHQKEEQKDNFCKFYFHHKVGDMRSGVDICLSDGDYYLSYLLKYTLVDGIYTTQSQLHNKIHDEYKKCGSNVCIIPRETLSDDMICHTKRIGLSDKKCSEESLASVIGINKHYMSKKQLPNREDILFEHINDNSSEFAGINLAEYSKSILGYCSKKIKDIKL